MSFVDERLLAKTAVAAGQAHTGPAARDADSGGGKPLLAVRDVSVRFGGIRALDAVGFDVRAGQIAGVIGPNGAGKTTLFNCLSRLCTPIAGDIAFEGRSILSSPRHAMSPLGIGRTFQNVALFDSLDVRDNVLMGGHGSGFSGFLGNALAWPAARREECELRERADEAISFMGLAPFASIRPRDLPFPIRKRVELARALMGRPKLLLLDEPAAGLSHAEVEVLKAQIRRLRDERQVTVLLVEHHMNLVMSISDKVVAMDFGRVIADGTPAQVQADPDVVRAYLGVD